MKYCDCGNVIDDDEDMCEECMNNLAAGIIHTDGIFPDEEDF